MAAPQRGQWLAWMLTMAKHLGQARVASWLPQ
jgi:hypothetical protein